MAQLLVRGLEDDVKIKLQQRAARNGTSMEAEVRDIIREALRGDSQPSEGLGTRIAGRFRGIGFKPGEELPEMRGFQIKSPFEE